MESLNNSSALANSTASQLSPAGSPIIAPQESGLALSGEIATDSTQVVPAKSSEPIVKTMLYVPENDAIIAPQRNVLGAFEIDSSRIAPKKVSAPIVKTVPYVPENDTISHPKYDVLTGDFVITNNESMASQLRINPISPLTGSAKEQQQITAVEPQEVPVDVRSAEKQVLVEASVESEVATAQDTAELLAEDVSCPDTLQAFGTAEIDADTIAVLTDSASADTMQMVAKARQQVYKEKEGKPIVRKTTGFALDKSMEETDWMIGVVIVSFVIFAWTRMIYGKFVGMMTQSAVNFYTARRVYEESNVIRTRVFFLLNILFYINISLFAAQCISFFKLDAVSRFSSFQWFGISCLCFFAAYSLKTLVLKILDFIFETKTFGAYNFSIYLYNKMYGLLLLPLVAVIPFVPDFVAEKLIWAGAILFIFFYVSTLFRGLRICIKNRVSIFYLFFYLCALEILPLLAIYKCVLKYVL